jgi:integrase
LRTGENPAKWTGTLAHLLPAPSKVQDVEHHKALPYESVSKVVGALSADARTTCRALKFLIATAARSGEVRGARLSEIDFDRRIWTIPGVRMKTGKDHRVPLNDAAIACLPHATNGDNGLLFEGVRPNSELSDMTLIKVLRRVADPATTVHGLRSSFRDWAAEQTDYPREVVEACLAHAIGSEVELAYKRTDFFEKRRDLMKTWGDYIQPAD